MGNPSLLQTTKNITDQAAILDLREQSRARHDSAPSSVRSVTLSPLQGMPFHSGTCSVNRACNGTLDVPTSAVPSISAEPPEKVPVKPPTALAAAEGKFQPGGVGVWVHDLSPPPLASAVGVRAGVVEIT